MFIDMLDWHKDLSREIFPYRDLMICALMEVGLKFDCSAVWHKKGVLSTKVQHNKRLNHTEYQLEPCIHHMLVFRHRQRRDLNPKLLDSGSRRLGLFHRNCTANDCPGVKDDEYHLLRQCLEFSPSNGSYRNGKIGGCNFSNQMVNFLIRAFTFEGDVVLDPFSGTHTVPKIAEQNGCKGIGFEIDRDTAMLAKEHLVDHPSTFVEERPPFPTGWLEIYRTWEKIFGNQFPSVFGNVIEELPCTIDEVNVA